ncbi:putative glutathione transferase [Lasiosphaeria ovina]|uniref:Glutathione transferase n=1 Tax=Lasiosphaeria ovina TaxID=92902 RepID=A0AAE0NLV2_9PEZI|nr:putative glutathione transferase [Lasiosphaeria ovina]
MAHFGIQQQSHFRRDNRPSGVLTVPDVAVLAGAGGGDNNDDGNEASQDDGVFPAVLHDYPALFNGPLAENAVPVAHGAFNPIEPGFHNELMPADSLAATAGQLDQQQLHQGHQRKQLPHQRQAQPQIQPPVRPHVIALSRALALAQAQTQAHHVEAQPHVQARAQVTSQGAVSTAGADYLPLGQYSNLTPTTPQTVRSLPHDSSTELTGANAGDDWDPAQIRFVENPPNLAEWRRKLFDLDETVFLSQQEYDMYFPWIDNVYSHRSTQRYKRKSFVSHYFDCRMKGRAPGTPKSDDPNKKKRKRNVRERNLCDVKIKISEYQTETSSAMAGLQTADVAGVDSEALAKAFSRFEDQPFWSIQRVNGNGTNGVGDGKPSKHRHTLGKSDEIKKCSVQRWLAARQKHARKNQRPTQWKPTGNAAATARKHTNDGKDDEIKFYAACFCPFSQRVWITLEAKGLEYQYCETDPFRKPAHLLEEDPVGLVPAVVKGIRPAPSPKPPTLRPCDESSIILEYLEEIDSTVLLHPTDARLKANCRLWIDFINAKLVPSFFSLLATTEEKSRSQGTKNLQRDIMTLVHAADEKGPYFLGHQLCLVDIHLAPFALRLSRILQPFRGWTPSSPDSRWQRWIDAIEDNLHVRNTVSTGNVYTGTVDLVSRGFSFRVD